MRHSGEIRWQDNTIYINAALVGEPIGLLEDDDGGWSVSYGPIELGVIAHGDNCLRKPKPPACGPCGQRCALPTGSTGETTTATRLNKTRNVLPMSSVRSVTHVPGCAGRGLGDVALQCSTARPPIPSLPQPNPLPTLPRKRGRVGRGRFRPLNKAIEIRNSRFRWGRESTWLPFVNLAPMRIAPTAGDVWHGSHIRERKGGPQCPTDATRARPLRQRSTRPIQIEMRLRPRLCHAAAF